MSILFSLPKAISVVIHIDWLYITGFVRLDTALCNHELLKYVFVLRELPIFILSGSVDLNWLLLRKLKAKRLSFVGLELFSFPSNSLKILANAKVETISLSNHQVYYDGGVYHRLKLARFINSCVELVNLEILDYIDFDITVVVAIKSIVQKLTHFTFVNTIKRQSAVISHMFDGLVGLFECLQCLVIKMNSNSFNFNVILGSVILMNSLQEVTIVFDALITWPGDSLGNLISTHSPLLRLLVLEGFKLSTKTTTKIFNNCKLIEILRFKEGEDQAHVYFEANVNGLKERKLDFKMHFFPTEKDPEWGLFMVAVGKLSILILHEVTFGLDLWIESVSAYQPDLRELYMYHCYSLESVTVYSLLTQCHKLTTFFDECSYTPSSIYHGVGYTFASFCFYVPSLRYLTIKNVLQITNSMSELITILNENTQLLSVNVRMYADSNPAKDMNKINDFIINSKHGVSINPDGSSLFWVPL
jgi:hypothetical protein